MSEKLIVANKNEMRISSLQEKGFSWDNTATKKYYDGQELAKDGYYSYKIGDTIYKNYSGDIPSKYEKVPSGISQINQDYIDVKGVRVGWYEERPSQRNFTYYYPLSSNLDYTTPSSVDNVVVGGEGGLAMSNTSLKDNGVIHFSPRYSFLGASPYIGKNKNLLKYLSSQNTFDNCWFRTTYNDTTKLTTVTTENCGTVESTSKSYIKHLNGNPYQASDSIRLNIFTNSRAIFKYEFTPSESGWYNFSCFVKGSTNNLEKLQGLSFVKKSSISNQVVSTYIKDESLESVPIYEKDVDYSQDNFNILTIWKRISRASYLEKDVTYIGVILTSGTNGYIDICGLMLERQYCPSTYASVVYTEEIESQTSNTPIYPIGIYDANCSLDKDWTILYRRLLIDRYKTSYTHDPVGYGFHYDTLGDSRFGYEIRSANGGGVPCYSNNSPSDSSLNSVDVNEYIGDWETVVISHTKDVSSVNITVLDTNTNSYSFTMNVSSFITTIGTNKFTMLLGGYFNNGTIEVTQGYYRDLFIVENKAFALSDIKSFYNNLFTVDKESSVSEAMFSSNLIEGMIL